MKRLLIAIALTSFPFAVSADDAANTTNTTPAANMAAAAANTPAAPTTPQTAAQPNANTKVAPTVTQQYSAAQRQFFEVPPQRVNPPGEGRVNEGRVKPPRGNDWLRRQAALEQDVRDSMSANGFTDPVLQNAILQHIKSESMARAPLRERGRRLYRGLNSPKVNDAEMSLALGAYITALEADRTRRALAEAALDEKIGWSKNPRLHSMLLLFGVIGESPITLPIRSFNQPPRAMPRPEDKPADEPAPTVVPAPPAQPPAAAQPPTETPPPVTVVPLGEPPTTDAPPVDDAQPADAPPADAPAPDAADEDMPAR